MKKLLFLICTTLLLVACGNDTASEPKEDQAATEQTQSKKVVEAEDPKAIPTSTKNLTNEQAKHIAVNVTNMMRTGANMTFSTHTLPGSYINYTSAAEYEAAWKKFLLPVMTENVLEQEVLSSISDQDMCYGCEFTIYGAAIHYNDDIVNVKVLDDETFTVRAYSPAGGIYPASDFVYVFSFIENSWKITQFSIEEPTGTEKENNNSPVLQALNTKATATIDDYTNYLSNQPNVSQADLSTIEYEHVETMKELVTQYEKIILTKDPYYEMDKAYFQKIYDDEIKYVEQDTQGGSGQFRFMTGKEAELLTSRLYELQYRTEGAF